MKKLLLSVFALAMCSVLNAQCNELFISEYVEGTGNDKALEIFNPTNSPINLTGYSIERYSNGSATASASSGGLLNLSGTIAAHDAFVIVNGQTTTIASPPSPLCSPALQAMADQLDGAYPAPMYMNGNDAIVLFHGSAIIDIFGKTGDAAMVSGYGWSDMFPYDGSAGANWTENHTLRRKATVLQGVTVNPSPEFNVTAEWDSLPQDTWTGLGSHVCNCATGINEIDNSVKVLVYPNPTNTDFFNISTSESIMTAELYNIEGELEIHKEGNKTDKQMRLETGNLAKGIYVVKLTFDKGRSSVVKISVQ